MDTPEENKVMPLSTERNPDNDLEILDKRVGFGGNYPAVDIFGQEYDRPANTRKMPRDTFGVGYFIVLPHRQLNAEEHEYIEGLLHPSQPLPGNEPTPNETESVVVSEETNPPAPQEWSPPAEAVSLPAPDDSSPSDTPTVSRFQSRSKRQ